MMKCEEFRDLIVEYGEWAEDDWNRRRVEEHAKGCRACAEELELWQESATIIQSIDFEDIDKLPERGAVSSNVMERIYADESWRLPVSEKLYAIPRRLRLRLISLIAGCLAMFGCGFLYYLMEPNSGAPSSGVLNVSALGGSEDTGIAIAGIDGIPVASIGDPIILGLSVVNTYPNYLFVLSLIGLICALLSLNWLARIRA
ncbi:zf-HC2 domain-containing protein [Paenibacillus sp. TRM 82003]|nr:zf-HC2 domain-containing protein [Paenibacillus sp. TRM 82003]